ncbi:MAG: PIG-L deacetylase family protein [Endomicrobiaceae bacterium]
MKYANYRSIFKMYEYIQPFLKYSTPLEEKLPAGKVLVIAPHQDDESIGCGGTIIKHTQNGGHLEVAFCTSDTIERMNETKNATKILGSKINHFLQFPIRSLSSSNTELSKRFTELFARVRPDIIFVPFLIDNHQDHVAISKALLKSYKQNKTDAIVYAYSVWTTLIPNLIVDVSDVWKEKTKAIDCYKTQTATRDYIKMALSIAQYWSVVKGKNTTHCEAFFKASMQEYVSFVKKVL